MFHLFDNMETKNVNNDKKLKYRSVAFENVNVPAFLDFWGPENVVQVYNPRLQMSGILVIDNTALGPGKGGIRISPTVTPKTFAALP